MTAPAFFQREARSVSRRDLLKTAVWAAGSCALPRSAGGQEPRAPPGETFAVLVDVTRCIGCRSCVRACARANRLPETEGSLAMAALETEQAPAFDLWTAVNARRVEGGTDAAPALRFVKRQCMHCLSAACASVCPVGALHQTASGPVVYRAERCIGCRYCMIACPFDAPRFDWRSGLTPVIGKCQFCAQERLFNGRPPACVESCPTGTLKFGKRASLLFEARARRRARPERYVPRVYGEEEVGGTSWLYLSDVPFESLGFPRDLPKGPLPSLKWDVISKIPVVATALAVLFGMVATTLPRRGETA